MHKKVKDPILSGRECPYCHKPTEFVDSSVVYGSSYGMIYLCKPCDAYCGVHKGTDVALGRLANETLRSLKKQAHSFFDGLWKRKMKTGFRKGHSRSKAYRWLSEQMSLPAELTHIGMFDEDQCKKVIELCKPYYKN